MIFGVIILQTVARGWYSDIFIHSLRRRGYFLGVQNSEVQFVCFFFFFLGGGGGFRDMNIFWV